MRRAILFAGLAAEKGTDWANDVASAKPAAEALVAEGDAYRAAGEPDAGLIRYREAGKLCDACPGLDGLAAEIEKTIAELTGNARPRYRWPKPR